MLTECLVFLEWLLVYRIRGTILQELQLLQELKWIELSEPRRKQLQFLQELSYFGINEPHLKQFLQFIGELRCPSSMNHYYKQNLQIITNWLTHLLNINAWVGEYKIVLVELGAFINFDSFLTSQKSQWTFHHLLLCLGLFVSVMLHFLCCACNRLMNIYCCRICKLS